MAGPPAPPQSDKLLADLARDYQVGFLRYLPRRAEVARSAAYELGRRALGDGVSLLEIVRIHHGVLRDVVASTPAEGADEVLDAGCEFLAEVLAAADMARRAIHDPERA